MQSFCNGTAYGVFMQAACHAAWRERVFRDRGNPLDTLNDFIEFYSWYGFQLGRQELNSAIEPHTERNAAISSVDPVVLALRYYATGVLNLDKSISLWQSNDSIKQ